MADGFAVAKFIEVGLKGGGSEGEVLVEEAGEVGWGAVGGGGVFLDGEEFYAVAGGEDESFADAGLVEEGAGGVGEAAGGDGEALAHFDGCGVVIDAQQDQALAGAGDVARFTHGVVNLWTEENWFAAQTARTTRKVKLER